LRFMIIGERKVGKQSLLLRFIEKKFIADTQMYSYEKFSDDWEETTLLKQILLEVGPDKIDCKVFVKAAKNLETSMRSQSLRNPFRGIDGVVLLYDVTNPKTLEGLSTRYQQVNQYGTNSTVILVGNKGDLTEGKEQTTLMAKAFAESNKLQWVEVSALDGSFVEETFTKLAEEVLQGKKKRNEVLK